MNIVYYCFAGAHASVVASAIHCGILPSDRVPTSAEFISMPYYDRTSPALIGRPYLMGCDEKNNSVYFMGMWNQREKITCTIQSLLKIAGLQDSSFILQDAFPLINFSTKCGGLLSKRSSFTKVGRSLTIWGMQRQYPEFVKLVNSVKNRLE
ncbi:MAG TPA: hypothetical protein DCP36_03685 [Sporomusaceae bacterium]|nr:hypothetical protein [Sporomusaceae bacterium]